MHEKLVGVTAIRQPADIAVNSVSSLVSGQRNYVRFVSAMDMQNILLYVGAVFLAVTYQLRRLENESVGESPFIKPSGNGASIIARWTSSGDDK
jgi:hypothetical protein